MPVLAGGQVSAWALFPLRGPATVSPLVRRGEEVFQARCQACHGAEPKVGTPGYGARMPGTEALAAKYKGSKPALLQQRTDLSADVVTYFVRNGSGIMPFFRKTELSDADLTALAAYLGRHRR
ncbi:MAG TPA: cytochrome c [Steroidobacteraceae bacterium]|jgi:mono/diheme cytochrome c family protein|nr:cytochrome c [Steroidobacteraceae bacterium]